jgi:hypothetical protein
MLGSSWLLRVHQTESFSSPFECQICKLPGQFPTTPQGNNNSICQILNPIQNQTANFDALLVTNEGAQLERKLGKQKNKGTKSERAFDFPEPPSPGRVPCKWTTAAVPG